MKRNNRKLYTICFIIGVLLLTALDQWTKSLAVAFLKGQPNIVLIPGVLELEYLENPGAAFGILAHQQVFFYIITVVLLAGILYVFYKVPMTKHFLPVHIVLTVIVAGAVGNLIDRVVQQYVVDFIYFSLIDFPKFNVADIYITLGCIVVFLLTLFKYKDDEFDMLFSKKKTSAE